MKPFSLAIILLASLLVGCEHKNRLVAPTDKNDEIKMNDPLPTDGNMPEPKAASTGGSYEK